MSCWHSGQMHRWCGCSGGGGRAGTSLALWGAGSRLRLVSSSVRQAGRAAAAVTAADAVASASMTAAPCSRTRVAAVAVLSAARVNASVAAGAHAARLTSDASGADVAAAAASHSMTVAPYSRSRVAAAVLTDARVSAAAGADCARASGADAGSAEGRWGGAGGGSSASLVCDEQLSSNTGLAAAYGRAAGCARLLLLYAGVPTGAGALVAAPSPAAAVSLERCILSA